MSKRVCSQWGKHPHEMDKPHFTEGGVGEMRLEQYPADHERGYVVFYMCKKCAREEYGDNGKPNMFGKFDNRFRWIVSPHKKSVDRW